MLFGLILAALAAAVAERLVPHGDGGRVTAYVRMIAGLFLLVVLLGPIGEGVALLREAADGALMERLPGVGLPDGELPDGVPTDYEAVWRDSLVAAGEHAVADWVRDTLRTDFGIAAKDARIAVLCAYADAEQASAGTAERPSEESAEGSSGETGAQPAEGLAETTGATEPGEGQQAGLLLREVRIALSGRAILQDPRPIEASIEAALGCACIVTME